MLNLFSNAIKFTDKLGAQTPVVRVMPNTPALFGQGMSVLCVNDGVSDEQKQFCETLFCLRT